MTEAEIRAALVAHLAASPDGEGAAFIAELFIDGFTRRADLVMANGVLSVFEIKSERDSLDRLEGQLESYARFFEQVTVVCAEKHLAGVKKHASERVGVWAISADGRIRSLRRATKRALQARSNWLSFLPVDELKVFLREKGRRATGDRTALMASAEREPIATVRSFVLGYLKRRRTRVDALIAKRSSRRALMPPPESVVQQRLAHFLEATPSVIGAIPRQTSHSSAPSSPLPLPLPPPS